MPHSIEYSDSGKNARITVDLNDVSYDSNINDTAARFVTAKNVVVNHVGPVERRGAIEDASTSTDLNAQSTNAMLHFFDGLMSSSSTYLPYVGSSWDSSNAEYYFQDDTGSPVLINQATGFPLPLAPAPMVDGELVFAGNKQAGTLAQSVYRYGGSPMGSTAYTTGTVNATVGSNVVAGSGTTWTADHVGSYLAISSETNTMSYRVVAVNSTIELVIDRDYNGDQNGAGKSYALSPMSLVDVNNTAVWTGDFPIAKIAANAWGRLVLGHVDDADTAGQSEAPRRLRWSGLTGSEIDGTAPFTGNLAWHANAFWDFPSAGGDLKDVISHGDAVLVFQERQLNIMYGTPVYDGIGSLDGSTVYTNVRLAEQGAVVSTPYGVYMIDPVQGIMHWDGSGPPQPISESILDSIVSLAPTSIGYYNEHLFVSKLSGSSMYVLHIPSNQWVEWTGTVGLTGFQKGRSDGAATHGDHYLVATDGTQVVNVSEAIDNPGTQVQDSGSTSFLVDLKTGSVGDWGVLLRPRRIHITYRAEDLSTTNPYLTVTVTTGMPDSQGLSHTESTLRLENTDGVETRQVELEGRSEDPIIQIQVAQTNDSGRVEIYDITVDCDVEGQWESLDAH